MRFLTEKDTTGYCMALCIVQTNMDNPYEYCERIYSHQRKKVSAKNKCIYDLHRGDGIVQKREISLLQRLFNWEKINFYSLALAIVFFVI